MDMVRIECYKDGNDVIVVFKNASAEIQDIVKSVLCEAMTKQLISDASTEGKAADTVEFTPVPLEPLDPEPMEKPTDFDSYEKMSIPDFLSDDYGTEIETKDDDGELSEESPGENIAEVSSAPLNNFDDMVVTLNFIKGANDERELAQAQSRLSEFYNVALTKFCKPHIAISRGEQERFLLACDRVFHDAIIKRIRTRMHQRMETFLSFASDKDTRELCSFCAKTVARAIVAKP